MILEYKDIANFTLSKDNSGSNTTITISGLAFHSALAVGDIDEQVNDHILTVKIHLVLARKGLSGRFKYKLNIPDDVSEVQFGEKGTTIWRREQE